jgi:hypothetical protein
VGLLDRLMGRPDPTIERQEHDADLKSETAKVKAYRNAEEVAEAARVLMEKALELRNEIEALSHE